MTRYIALYEAPEAVAERFARATPEEAQQGLAAWTAWGTRLGPALLYPGAPLGHAARITVSGVEETRSPIVGMSIIEAASRDEALELVRDHHHLGWAHDCSIVLLEEQAIPELETAAPA